MIITLSHFKSIAFRFALFILIATFLAQSFPVPRASAAFTPAEGVIFNNPFGTTAQRYAIDNHLVNSINSTPAGATIRFAMFSIDDTNVVNALINAYKRGVHVKLIVDKKNASFDTLVTTLKQVKTANSFIFKCSYGCMSSSTGSMMHAKLYLFSTVGSTTAVSMIGSANPTYTNSADSWNNLYTITGNRDMYLANIQFFNDMLLDKTDLSYYWSKDLGKYKVYYLPRDSGLENFYLSVLSDVACTGVKTGYGYNGRTVIRVNMYWWGNDMANVAKKLWDLDNAGCEVQIILNNDADSNPATVNKLGSQILPELLKSGGAYGKMSVYNAINDNNGATYNRNTHHKFLTIDGSYYGNTGTKVTFTGSTNWSQISQTEDNDIILKITDAAITNQYMTHFRYMRDNYTTQILAP